VRISYNDASRAANCRPLRFIRDALREESRSSDLQVFPRPYSVSSRLRPLLNIWRDLMYATHGIFLDYTKPPSTDTTLCLVSFCSSCLIRPQSIPTTNRAGGECKITARRLSPPHDHPTLRHRVLVSANTH